MQRGDLLIPLMPVCEQNRQFALTAKERRAYHQDCITTNPSSALEHQRSVIRDDCEVNKHQFIVQVQAAANLTIDAVLRSENISLRSPQQA